MAVYNLTNVTSANSPLDLVQATNNLAHMLPATMMLIGTFIVLFIAMKNYPTKTAFGVSGITTAILATFLALAQLIPNTTLIIATVIGGIGVVTILID